MAGIRHQFSPRTVPDKELLPSQKTLLAFEAPLPNWANRYRLDVKSVNRLGGIMLDHLASSVDRHSGHFSLPRNQVARNFTLLAERLIQHQERHRVSESVFVTTQATYNQNSPYTRETPPLIGQQKVFTPRGYVFNPSQDFRQKVVAFSINSPLIKDIFLDNEPKDIHLYTDNLLRATPSWQFTDAYSSDMFPGSDGAPYEFHKPPLGFISETAAQNTIEQLVGIVRPN